MRVRSVVTLAAVVGATITLAACGATDSTAPIPPAIQSAPSDASSNLLGTLLGAPRTITPLKRKTPLAAPITVSKTIGILGGTIAIPQAGIAVVVPPLAVPSTKTITVTALAGDNVAYEFQPHGLKFTLPLVVTQDVSKTSATQNGLLSGLALKLGYFPDANHVTTVTELLNVQLDLLHLTAISTVWHFSGYIYASGRESEGDF
jgi:hypothetical protein